MNFKILVDADAIPAKVREVIARYAQRKQYPTVFVSNHYFQLPKNPYVEQRIVEKQFDQADNQIVEWSEKGSLVIAQDLLLAQNAIKKGARVLTLYGEELTQEKVNERMSFRDLYSQLRDMSMESGGNQKTYSQKDLQNFSNSLNNGNW